MRSLGLGALLCLAISAAAPAVLARVGGGESFGGGDSGGGDFGDSGGGGTGELVGWLLWLVVQNPEFGLPALAVAGVVLIIRARMRRDRPALSAPSWAGGAPMPVDARSRRENLARLVQEDPQFSEPLFLDFARMIYARYQEGRGGDNIEGLRPYVSDRLWGPLVAGEPGRERPRVSQVIVGSLAIELISFEADHVAISCALQGNYTETRTEAGTTFFVSSQLVFRRNRGVVSLPPERMRSLSCPSCGAGEKLDREGVCAFCGQAVPPGAFQWQLFSVLDYTRIPRAAMELAVDQPERGTDRPTWFDPDLDTEVRAFAARNPQDSIQRLLDRATEIFLLLQKAWSDGRWERARAFETDRVYQMHLFWMLRYQEKGIRNVLSDVQVHKVELAKLRRDAFYESATLRIHASMIDYKIDSSGQVVGGSRKVPRRFSEYWTFIRRAGFVPRGDSSACPSCGAPVKVAMDGRCEFCHNHIASGDFDWTLSAIEQDESYAG